ncbi:MAG: 1,4-dihydroxy-2-naphthoate octaprenyltransferase [Cytophagales bacterium]
MNIKAWISAARLRTLPLAFSVILMGSALAYSEGSFKLNVLILSLLTTLFLQILSNYANDLGDSQNGADNALRVGETRAVQSGLISQKQMLSGVIVMSVLAFAAGVGLLKTAFGTFNATFLFFLVLGLASIGAAIKYTAGKSPYGYAGLGDLSVFVFFGLVGVVGSYYLHTLRIANYASLLLAYSCGVFSVGVLNLNNMRDILPDAMAKKQTIPVRIGYENAKKYHIFLIASGFISAIVYLLANGKTWQSFILMPSLHTFNFFVLRPLLAAKASDNIDSLLKKMAFSTLLFVVLFAISINV